MFPILASFDSYWPYRLSLERGLKFDYKEILVPTIAFVSKRFGLQVFDS